MFLSTALAASLVLQAPPTDPPLNLDPQIVAAEKAAGLRFDELFPRKSNFGRGAGGLTWSKDGRHLAFVWGPYDTKGGSDLYVFDAKEKKTVRVTSPEGMRKFDRNIAKAIERYKKDREEEDKAAKLTDLEYREWRLKRAEEAAKLDPPAPNYPSVGEIAWSPKGGEVLFTWSGDVFRTTVADPKPVRLTRTREAESRIEWLPDADGYTYQRAGGVFRVRFATGAVEQLNPELPRGVTFESYRLSPDGTKLVVTASKNVPGERQVDWISYRNRFAEARKAGRGVADDEFKGESYVYLYDLTQDSLDEVTGDGKPWEVWKWPGGKEWQEISVAEKPWSPDSKKFVFGTWKRTAREQELIIADTGTKKLQTFYRGKPDGEHTTPGMARPEFTRDGARVIAMLDATGYRQPWILDPVKETAEPITKGEFDCYPLRQTADGKHLLVEAEREQAGRSCIYRVEIATGAFDRIGRADGNYSGPAISDDGASVAAGFGNWSSPRELAVLDGKGHHQVTESHNLAAIEKLNTLKPQLFDYKNRQGQTIHGFMFLPPGLKKTDKRPLMIYVYGGPLGTGKSVEDGAFGSTDYWFAMYLARVFGYVCVTIDPRGQSGYGNAFGKANYEQPGKAQTEDLADGVKFLVENHGVDPKKVGINGWSFGGFQTQHSMYSAPETFTLGIAGAGPTEWQNYNNWYSTGVIGPVPNGKPEDLDKYSLTHIAKNLRGPLLLLHGMEDTNVLFQDTVKVYRKLLQYGKGPLVELALDPTGGHGMGGDMDNRDRHAIYLGFVKKWWGIYKG